MVAVVFCDHGGGPCRGGDGRVRVLAQALAEDANLHVAFGVDYEGYRRETWALVSQQPDAG